MAGGLAPPPAPPWFRSATGDRPRASRRRRPPSPSLFSLFLSFFLFFSSSCPSPSPLGQQHGWPPPANRTPPDTFPVPVEVVVHAPGTAGLGLTREPKSAPAAEEGLRGPLSLLPGRLERPSLHDRRRRGVRHSHRRSSGVLHLSSLSLSELLLTLPAWRNPSGSGCWVRRELLPPFYPGEGRGQRAAPIGNYGWRLPLRSKMAEPARGAALFQEQGFTLCDGDSQ